MKISLICDRALYQSLTGNPSSPGGNPHSSSDTAPHPVVVNFVNALKKLGHTLVWDDLGCDAAVTMVHGYTPDRIRQYKAAGIPVVFYYYYTYLLTYVSILKFRQDEWDAEKAGLEYMLKNCDAILLGGYPQVGDIQQIFRHPGPILDLERIHIIHQYCDENLFYPDTAANPAMRRSLGIAEDETVFLYHGTFNPILGLEFFIEGMLASSNPRIRCLLIGDGKTFPRRHIASYRKGTRESLTELAREDRRFLFIDWQSPDVLRRYLNMADLYISHLSDHIKVHYFYRTGAMEAIGCGLPVLASNTLGAHYFIRSGANGILLPPNDPGEVTAFLDRLDPDEIRRWKINMTGRVRQEPWYFDRANLETIRNIFRSLPQRSSKTEYISQSK